MGLRIVTFVAMNLAEWLLEYQQRLHKIYDKDEIEALFLLTVKELINYNRVDFILHKQTELSDEVNIKLKNTLIDLIDGKPIQYIFGHTYFYGLPFEVNLEVLIPRPETEELVHWILDVVGGENVNKLVQPNLKILDIGTGSGCIAISLKKHLSKATVSAIDISEAALKIARNNARLNEVNVNFAIADILKPDVEFEHIKFDLIVSNPPYIKENEKSDMHQNVLSQEPHIALFVSDEEPLIFYRAIAEFALQNLNKTGLLFFEINEYLGQDTVAMLTDKGFINIEVRKDMQGKDRMISAHI